MTMRTEQNFPPIVYAVLAALVIFAFAVAGKVEWYWVAITPACIYSSEKFWRNRRPR